MTTAFCPSTFRRSRVRRSAPALQSMRPVGSPKQQHRVDRCNVRNRRNLAVRTRPGEGPESTLLSHSDRGQRRTFRVTNLPFDACPELALVECMPSCLPRAFIAPKRKTPHGLARMGLPIRGSFQEKCGERLMPFGRRCNGGSDLLEVPVDITVVYGVVAFDDAGFADGEPAHHQ